MKRTLIVALLLSCLPMSPPGAAQTTSAMERDVERLVQAAEKLTGSWPAQSPPPIAEVDMVARHGQAVVPLLMQLLAEDPNAERNRQRWKVQQQAALTLARIYSEPLSCGRIYCDGDPPERVARVKAGWQNVIATRRQVASVSSRELLERFQQEEVFWRHHEIGITLAATKDRTIVDAIAPSLQDEDRHVRGNAAFVLALLGDPRGIATIVGILEDRTPRPPGQGMPGGNWTVQAQIRADRYYAAHLLGDLKDPRGVALLIPLLNDPEVDSIVPWSLAEIGDRRAIAPLIAQLRQDDPTKRVSAIYALERLRAREALPRLRELLEDFRTPRFGDPVTVSEAARRAIAVISAQP